MKAIHKNKLGTLKGNELLKVILKNGKIEVGYLSATRASTPSFCSISEGILDNIVLKRKTDFGIDQKDEFESDLIIDASDIDTIYILNELKES